MGYPMGAPVRSSGKATASLVCGILGLILCGIFTAIPAIILGGQAIREIDASGGAISGRGQASAGRVLGFISVALTVIVVIIWLVVVVFAASSDTTSSLG